MAELGFDCDLLVIGGGINGAGIARDAAGRGLHVVLVEKGDLAGESEHYEFRLVGEALAEREVLLKMAPHLVAPLAFVMPHVPELRPRWMIRVGLFLYDHLGRRTSLPGSRSINLAVPPYNAGLKPCFTNGFVYSDCRVDDARLVVANAMGARQHGAEIHTRTECLSARREQSGWNVTIRTDGAREHAIRARALVNAAGPWVKEVLNQRLAQPSSDNVKLVQGSHIVVPRLYVGEHAFILQNDDRRVIFMIPYEGEYTLIGTTDIALDRNPAAPHASTQEIGYLCKAVNRYVAAPIAPASVVWSYAGVRPLYDDGTADPSAVTRDYTLRLDAAPGFAPVLSVFGGKITTYRRLAEHALAKLAPWFPGMKSAWTQRVPLPGGDLPAGDFEHFVEDFALRDYPWLPGTISRSLARRHGSNVAQVLGDAKSPADLGAHFGAGLFAREVDYMIAQEWATSTEDILFRRTKAGLHLTSAQQTALAQYVARATGQAPATR